MLQFLTAFTITGGDVNPKSTGNAIVLSAFMHGVWMALVAVPLARLQLEPFKTGSGTHTVFDSMIVLLAMFAAIAPALWSFHILSTSAGPQTATTMGVLRRAMLFGVFIFVGAFLGRWVMLRLFGGPLAKQTRHAVSNEQESPDWRGKVSSRATFRRRKLKRNRVVRY